MSSQTWFERQIQNLYGVGTDGQYTDNNNRVGFYFNQDAASILGGDGGITGYFNVNSGNRAIDAIATIALNELGIDNAYKAFLNAREGNYGSAFKELAFGVGELAFNATGIGRVAMFGARNLPRTFRAARPVTQSRVGGKFGPMTPATNAGLGRRTIQAAGRIPSASAAALRQGAITGTGAVLRSTGKAIASGTGSLLPKGSRLGRLGALAVPLAYLSASLTRDPSGFLPGEAEEEAATTSSPELVRRGGADASADAANQARVNIAGINQQYNNILRELQGMYQLSETDEERERLRFMLADIEAQKDAGLRAISEGYSQTVSQIQQEATLAGERTTERSQRYGSELEASADRAAQRMMLQNIDQQQQFRGLGSGSQAPVNEFVGLMSAMAPAQQLYTQRMGDISREGMEWLAQTVGAQGQAQGADLQRLAGATRSGAIARQQAEVSERINRERELQRAGILQAMQQQASALQSAEQFNVSQNKEVDAATRANTINSLAAQGYNAAGIRQFFQSSGLGDFDPSEEALARIAETVARVK